MLTSAFNESVSVMDKKLPWIVCFSAALFLSQRMVSSQDGCSKREIAVQIGDDIYAELDPVLVELTKTFEASLQAAKSLAENASAAKGQFPDQEWQARHRLIAIERKK